MTDRDDHLLVELLYDEVPTADAAAARETLLRDGESARELADLEATLGLVRSVPDEEPPAFLDAKILAEARQVADTAGRGGWSDWIRMLTRPVFGAALAGVTAAGVAMILLPMLMKSPELSQGDLESVARREALAPSSAAPAQRAPSLNEQVAKSDDDELTSKSLAGGKGFGGAEGDEIGSTGTADLRPAPPAPKPRAVLEYAPAEERKDDAKGLGLLGQKAKKRAPSRRDLAPAAEEAEAEPAPRRARRSRPVLKAEKPRTPSAVPPAPAPPAEDGIAESAPRVSAAAPADDPALPAADRAGEPAPRRSAAAAARATADTAPAEAPAPVRPAAPAKPQPRAATARERVGATSGVAKTESRSAGPGRGQSVDRAGAIDAKVLSALSRANSAERSGRIDLARRTYEAELYRLRRAKKRSPRDESRLLLRFAEFELRRRSYARAESLALQALKGAGPADRRAAQRVVGAARDGRRSR